MNSDFFQSNRNNLIEATNGGLAVLFAYGRLQRSNDAAHPFTQESNFWYLCGIEEPDWVLIIDGSNRRSYLVMPDMQQAHRTFDGSLSTERAKEISGVDKVIDTDESIDLLKNLSKIHSLVHTVGVPSHAEYFNFSLNPSIARGYQKLERQFSRIQDVQNDMAKMRAIKRPEEIIMLRKAIDITVEAFELVSSKMSSYRSEYEIESDFSHRIRSSGASGHAYDPIIAAGLNACTLHYSHNKSDIRSGQMVLMDVGASYGGYAADITRTYAKGKATKRQIQVHGAVEAAHKRIIDLLKPLLPAEEYQRNVDAIMVEALDSLGLPSDEDGLHRYFPHAVSHGLGVDVHDSLGGPKYLQEGMVLTVEPGIYIPEENLGVRIEDDILITKDGRTNLSVKLSTGL